MQRLYLVKLNGNAIASSPLYRSLPWSIFSRRSSYFIGNKALGLQALIGLGLPVPRTYVCTWDAYERFRSGDPGLEQTLKAELAAIVRFGPVLCRAFVDEHRG